MLINRTHSDLFFTRGMRVGLFGGSFNPPHEGHFHVAKTALTRTNADRIIWLVSPQNPLKSAAQTAPYEQRLEATKKIAVDPRFIVSDLEATAKFYRSFETVAFLQARFPDVHFFWVTGADNLHSFHRWEHYNRIVRSIPIVAIDRKSYGFRATSCKILIQYKAAFENRKNPNKAPNITILRAPFKNISSTEIRSALKSR